MCKRDNQIREKHEGDGEFINFQGRCNREKPPCKYFHPPQHLKDQLLINGRNHLALKNALMQQMGLTPGQVLPGQVPAVVSEFVLHTLTLNECFERSALKYQVHCARNTQLSV